MADSTLKGKSIAILATDGFEQSELQGPHQRLTDMGATVHVLTPGDATEIRGWKGKDWGDKVAVDKSLDAATAADYDGLVLPGGVINPDKLRLESTAIAFIQAFDAAGKPVAAICHGPWLLIESGLVKGKKVTSWPSLKTDLGNAGGHWEDSEVVVDGNLITSRKPEDIAAFSAAIGKAVAG